MWCCGIAPYKIAFRSFARGEIDACHKAWFGLGGNWPSFPEGNVMGGCAAFGRRREQEDLRAQPVPKCSSRPVPLEHAPLLRFL